MILDYGDQVTEYLKDNFTPSDDNRANLKWTTGEMLQFLFDVFPRNCISDYELNDILIELGYKRYAWVQDSISSKEENGEEIFTITKSLVTGWCLRTDFSLETEVIEGK